MVMGSITDRYSQQIKKTGFVLEYQVTSMLRAAGWTVISNKYYEDDFEESIREIDLLAYKVSKKQGIDVYTTLLISCKKSDANIWALLGRDLNLGDPNVNWWPLHAWSNNKVLDFQLKAAMIGKKYHNDLISGGIKEALSMPQCEVFAFQEMNRESGAPQNDKNIFNSVISLIKAQAYEIGALSSRKKKPSVYQFNLVSIIDSELIRLTIGDDEIKQESISSEHYISRYIIKKKESFSRVRFIAFGSFAKSLPDYDRQHQLNCSWFDSLIQSYFKDPLKDIEKAKVLLDEFRNAVYWDLWLSAKRAGSNDLEKNDIALGWSLDLACPIVLLSTTDAVIQSLNENQSLGQSIQSAFNDVYRYQGTFILEENIPF
jgi:hypothetical protein